MAAETRGWAERSNVAALVVVAAVLLLTAAPPPNTLHYHAYIKYTLLQTGVCALAVIWAVRCMAVSRQGNGSAAPAETLLLCFVALAFFSAVWSGLPYITLLAAAVLAFRVGWGLLVGAFAWTGKRLLSFAGVVVAGGAFASVCTLVLWAMGHEAWLAYVIGHRNFLACFLIPPLCIAVERTLALSSQTDAPRPRRYAWLAAALPMVIVFVMADAIGAYVGIAAAAVAFVFVRSGRRLRRRIAFGLAVAALVVAIVAVLAWPGLRPKLLQTEQSTRYFHAVGALRMIAARPLFGWGMGTYESRFPHFRPVEAGRYGRMGQLSLHPHNEFAAVAIQTGLVGLALLLSALLITFRRVLRRLPQEEQRPLIAAILAGATGMLAHGVFTVSLSFWGAAAMFWTILGVLLSIARGPAESAPRRELCLKDWAPVVVCTGLLCVAWWQFAWEGLASEWALGEARFAKRPHEEAVPLYEQAIARSRYAPDYIHAHDLTFHATQQ